MGVYSYCTIRREREDVWRTLKRVYLSSPSNILASLVLDFNNVASLLRQRVAGLLYVSPRDRITWINNSIFFFFSFLAKILYYLEIFFLHINARCITDNEESINSSWFNVLYKCFVSYNTFSILWISEKDQPLERPFFFILRDVTILLLSLLMIVSLTYFYAI